MEQLDNIDMPIYPELLALDASEDSCSEQRPVSSQPYDWTVSALRDKCERGLIDLQPSFQREYVWQYKPELPSRLIGTGIAKLSLGAIRCRKALPGMRFKNE